MSELILRCGVSEEDDADVLAAVNRGRVAAGLEPRSPELWHWWTRANGPGACVGTARDRCDGDAIAAAIVGVRHRTLLRGEPTTWVEVVDLFNDFERGAGLVRARRLIELGRAWADAFGGPAPDAHPVMYGLPNRRAHRLGLRHLGWEILRSENALLADLDTLSPAADAAVEVEEAETFPDETAGAFERFAQGRAALVVRDAEHQNWRYAQHPLHRYRIALARRGGELRGWAVYRRPEASGPSGSSGSSEAGVLCDWLVPPDEQGVAGELLAWARARARADGLARLAVNVPDKSPEWSSFQDVGFRVRGTDEYLVFRSFQKPYVMSWLFEHWYYTQGDTQRC